MNSLKSRIRINIAGKLISIVIIIVLCLSIIIPFFASTEFGTFYKENVANKAASIAQTLAKTIEFAYQKDLFENSNVEKNEELLGLLRKTVENITIKRIYIVKNYDEQNLAYVADVIDDREHDTAVNSFNTLRRKDTFNQSLLSIFDKSKDIGYEDITYTDTIDDGITGYAPITYNGRVVAAIAVKIYTDDFHKIVGRYTFLAALIVVIANVIAGIVCFVLIKKAIVHPLIKIRYAAEQIADQKLDFILDIKNNDEIGDVAKVINKNVVPSLVELKEKNISIEESMNYAGKIQRNILPDNCEMSKAFRDFHIWWQPKESVGGDLYWLKNFEKGTVLIVGDCTGHSVSGAMMTMMVNAILSQIITEENCENTDVIVSILDKKLFSMLNNSDTVSDGIRDGLDAIVIFIDHDKNITLSSTNLSVIISSGSATRTIKGQRSAIGEGSLFDLGNIKKYTVPYLSQNMYFIATDGLTDQVGEKTRLPLGNARLKRLIDSFDDISMEDAILQITSKLIDYKGTELQRDDITVIGFKL